MGRLVLVVLVLVLLALLVLLVLVLVVVLVLVLLALLVLLVLLLVVQLVLLLVLLVMLLLMVVLVLLLLLLLTRGGARRGLRLPVVSTMRRPVLHQSESFTPRISSFAPAISQSDARASCDCPFARKISQSSG